MPTSRNAVCGHGNRGNATGWLSLAVAVRQPHPAWPRPDFGRADHSEGAAYLLDPPSWGTWCRTTTSSSRTSQITADQAFDDCHVSSTPWFVLVGVGPCRDGSFADFLLASPLRDWSVIVGARGRDECCLIGGCAPSSVGPPAAGWCSGGETARPRQAVDGDLRRTRFAVAFTGAVISAPAVNLAAA